MRPENGLMFEGYWHLVKGLSVSPLQTTEQKNAVLDNF